MSFPWVPSGFFYGSLEDESADSGVGHRPTVAARRGSVAGRPLLLPFKEPGCLETGRFERSNEVPPSEGSPCPDRSRLRKLLLRPRMGGDSTSFCRTTAAISRWWSG